MSDIRKLQNGSDIRGIALAGVEGEDVNLSLNEAYVIGNAFTKWLSKKKNKNTSTLKICIGRDPRITGKDLTEGLFQGIYAAGAVAVNAGLASTPAMFMSTIMSGFEFDGAIMVTASHLPYNRNGFKFFTSEGGLNKEDISTILDEAAEQIATCDAYTKIHTNEYKNDEVKLMDAYASHLRSIIKNNTNGDLSNLKIVIDAGNGAGGFFATEVLAPLGADISGSQFLEPDGFFPNHMPNPENKEAMNSICARVIETNADLGIIFDTDVDRSAAVTSSGTPLARNEIVALAAALGAKNHPGGTVITDSITSNELHTFLTATLGLKHLRFKRGYRNVINKGIELSAQGEDAFLSIETSGHAAYKDNYWLDDGAYLAVQIIIMTANLKSNSGKIEDLIKDLEKPAESEEYRIKITSSDFSSIGDKVIEKLENWATTTEGLSLEIPNYEGVRINFILNGTKGWFLLRKSLHDPVLPLNIESKEKGGIKAILPMIKEQLNGINGLDISSLNI